MRLGEIALLYMPVINFAMQQNGVPVIKKLSAKNISDNDLEQVTLSFRTDPAFALPFDHTIDVIKKGETLELTNLLLPLSPQYLCELTERITGTIILTVAQHKEEVQTSHYPIDLLAYDQWNGSAILPEMLCTFVTPNHPQLSKIIIRASQILGNWTGTPSFDAYQSQNPDRIKKQMAAIYEAIAEMNIVYCTVPASFEERGQRIRMCDTILSTGMANCLDLSLLYAACLEAAGIHPLLILIKEHAFVGAWLAEESFADAVNDDVSLLTKRTAEGIHEILLVEATCMNAGSNTPFDEAVRNANSKLLKEEDFHLFIDVKRARFSGIRPLPLRVKTADGWQMTANEKNTRNNHLPEEIISTPKLVQVDKIEVSKQMLWERKLLDLTLRNSLLNLRITKSTIQFMGLPLSMLEDALANGDELQVLPKPTDWDNPLRSAGVYQSIHQHDPMLNLIKHEFTQKRLRAYLSESELLLAITNLYRAARLSIEENGANTLYVALGLLKWYETAASEKPRYAPLLLVPAEIVKKSAQKGFIIRSREEETMINITLLEMLRQDFGITIGGLDNLPKDESGVDVKAVFSIVRQAVMTKKGWDVEEQSILATFSFSKFILWNDIHYNTPNLFKNKVVRSLVSGRLEWQPKDQHQHIDLDNLVHPADIALPISSDASQLKAILTSAVDESFVLHGPPGTGKSQTITNIIANALYKGKKVLFVSAKKAALDVVHTRLHAIGIGAFCMELHSNKSKKSSVLEQLKKAAEAVKYVAPGTYQSEGERLYALRKELNEYVQALHRQQSFGLSLSQLFNKYSELLPAAQEVFFGAKDIQQLTGCKLILWNDLAEEMAVIAAICGNVATHPLKEICRSGYTQQLKLEAKTLLAAYTTGLAGYVPLCQTVTKALQIEMEVATKEQVAIIKDITRLLLSLPEVPSGLFGIDHAEQNLAYIIDVANHGIKRDELRRQLLQVFNKNALTLNASLLLSEWRIAAQKWFLPKYIKQNGIVKELKRVSLTGNISKEEAESLLENIVACQSEQEIIDKAADLPNTLQFLWKGGECNWQQLITICNSIISINRQFIKLQPTGDAAKWRRKLGDYFYIYNGVKAYIKAHKTAFENFTLLVKELEVLEAKLQTLLDIHFQTLPNSSNHWVDTYNTYASQWLQHIDLLKDWMGWNSIKEKAVQAGLTPLITAYENNNIQPGELVAAYQRGLYKSCADYIIDTYPVLSSFNGKLFDEKIKKFREISRQYEQLTREELYARLAANIPDFTKEAAQTSEIGMLQKTIRNGGRAMSIRKLFDAIPNLLPRLAPCMLMSPISVAQYFDTSNEIFDLLVFDEASQMPTCEAVGAIARARNVIVVGDPKQMPPTSFFSTNNFDEENAEKEDLESILDDCLALSVPSQHLLWHYRSRHESLIAFSNAHYYDNKLLTFPSTDDIISRVSYVPVEGFYDKGKTRQNHFEAKAIVEEVIRRLSDPVLCRQSIGIVTFSVVQQFLIDDLLSDVFAARPDLEKKATEREEPLFIKNLENVQGDERDVILFSVGYGPDKEGKVSLNFGPINREGGWRRLNVAVSRARYEMKVFSTLKSEGIDLNRTASQGVAGLKAFFAYAEKGRTGLPARVANNTAGKTAFIDGLAAQIEAHGYTVNTNIGCSTYKMDIGIINGANTNEYLLGVLCDGDHYYNATTMRDREITQPAVLESLGWNIHKVWSADWWEQPQKTVQAVLEKIKWAQENKAKNALPMVNEAAPQTPVVPKVEALVYNKPQPAVYHYEVTNLAPVNSTSSDEFLSFSNKRKILAQIEQVLQTEAPVSKNLLSKRVLNAWGISRNGARINAYFEILFAEVNMQQVTHRQAVFCWRSEQQPSSYSIYRSAKKDAEKREADDLPPEETANAARQVLKAQIALSKDDLVRETAKLFHFSKVGNNVDAAMRKGIQLLIDNGEAKEEKGRVVWGEENIMIFTLVVLSYIAKLPNLLY